MMWIYAVLIIFIAVWVMLGIYVFSEIKKTYDRGGVFTSKLLLIWYVMWGFHHLTLILSSLYGLWSIPINRTFALAGGLILFVAGVVILPAGMIEFRSLRRSTGQDISKLITTGIYQWSRNPQFLGWSLMLFGVSLIGRSGLALALTVVFVIILHLYTVRLEEPYLERLYGDEYCMYKSRAARWIGIPKEDIQN